jgi:hypothetical protein
MCVERLHSVVVMKAWEWQQRGQQQLLEPAPVASPRAQTNVGSLCSLGREGTTAAGAHSIVNGVTPVGNIADNLPLCASTSTVLQAANLALYSEY